MGIGKLFNPERVEGSGFGVYGLKLETLKLNRIRLRADKWGFGVEASGQVERIWDQCPTLYRIRD